MKQLVFLVMICFTVVSAIGQPSDATVLKDAKGDAGASIKSIKLTKATGTRQWNSSLGNWEYVRGVQAVRTSEYAGIDLIVNEDVVYQYNGNGKYSFLKVRVIDNQYVGLPNPSAKEVQEFISKNWGKFYGNYYYSVITKILHQPVLADTPRWN
jgi:hypothetical protein